ncbi:MAG: KEOPS complex N(6)-L-threonylcarbamoyladenine synthase Kae1 [Candidatus Micrarchaeaceae archaeon]
MAVLGIESSAHTFGMGIANNGKIIANEKEMFPISDKGLIPMKVAEFHAKNARKLLNRTLKMAGMEIEDLDGIGYTMGPGLGPCLDVGRVAATTLSQLYSLPIFPVNHALAHIEIARILNSFSDPVALYVSGGNSQILAYNKQLKKYQVYGETFDIGIGNMFDSFAKAMHLKPAWGSSVAKLALDGKYIAMPYTVKGMDFAFTGLLTNSIDKVQSGMNEKDVAFSLQENAFAMLCEATERALMLLKKKELEVCGGVAQSTRLKEMLRLMAKEHGIRFGCAEDEYNADNGAMIAVVAEEMQKAGMKFTLGDCTVNQKYRIDNVRIEWR